MELTRRERSILTWLGILLVAFLAIQVAMLVLGALAHVVDVILIFLVAWALAYMMVPLVDLIDRRTPLDRWGAVLVVYLAVALLLAATLALVVPVLASQLVTLVDRAPEYGDRAARVVVDWQAQLDRAGFRIDVAGLYGTLPERVGEVTGAIAADALGLVAATGALLFNVTLVLIIAFIMLIDGDALWRRFTSLLSEELRSEAELFRQSADRSFGGFVRASLLLGLVYGVATLVILVPFGVPFSALLALLGGLVMMIPFFGPIIAMIPIVVVTLLGKPDALLPVLVLSLALQQVMLNVVGPRLMANVIGIHPLFVFLALLLGARLAGFWGVLLAMPIAGIANIFARYVFEVTQGRRARTEAARLIDGGSSAPEDIRAAGR
ncbi:MAG: AI-2E family transporter [Chloroflexota bacterium]